MKLEEEIKDLKLLTLKMGKIVIENLRNAIDIYYEYDDAKADLINDDVVDKWERLIEETCLNIMLRERPFAGDLRYVSGILTLVSDLERLGDHAEDIRDFSSKLKGTNKHKIKELDDAVEKSLEMVKDAISAFENNDIKLANDVIQRDDIIDALYENCLSILIKSLGENVFSPKCSIYTTLIVKYIERIADHAVNIAEWVIYIDSGYYKDKQIF